MTCKEKVDEVLKLERRKTKRIKKFIPVTVNQGTGTLIDLSRGGLGIEPHFIPVGETIHVSLKFGKNLLDIQGKIRWVHFGAGEIKHRNNANGAAVKAVCRAGFVITHAPPEYYLLVAELESIWGELVNPN